MITSFKKIIVKKRTPQKILLLIAIFILSCMQTTYAEKINNIRYLDSGKVLPPGFPLAEAVRVDNMLYVSGMVGFVPGTKGLAPGGIKAETKQTMINIKTILEAHNYSLDNLIRCRVMLADIAEWGTFNEAYQTFFSDHYPARAAFGVSGLALGARVEVECAAAK